MTENALYYGDNLEILRDRIPDNSVDLIYLDPPFNSKADYNILFQEPTGTPSKAQITAFGDTWHWTEETERAYDEIITSASSNVSEMMIAFRQFMGKRGNDMLAYLVMMCIRLIELRRVLKDTGSIYLHCDPTASHYIKVMMDGIFGPQNFINEIIWKRTSAHSSAKRYGPVHDIIIMYSRSDHLIWNSQIQPYDESYIENFYRSKDKHGQYRVGDLTGAGVRTGESGKSWRGIDPTVKGRHWAVPKKLPKGFTCSDFEELETHERLEKLDKLGLIHWPKIEGGIPQFKRYLDRSKGTPLQDIWTDINPIGAHAKERLGYPTQKPEGLLERIIMASSNEGAVILDPFCGCGTTITAAQKLNRTWIGIDITHLATNLIKWRMRDMFGLEPKRDYKVIGEPEDLAGAMELASQNRYQFQWWALSLILNAKPYGGKKKGADGGIDGSLFFSDEKGKFKKCIIQVKSGKVSVKDIRDLGHVIDREGAEIGLFITLEDLTKPMVREAVTKGLYTSPASGTKYPRLQILTTEELLAGNQPNIPTTAAVFKKADLHQEQIPLIE